jgi:hypothetical protein
MWMKKTCSPRPGLMAATRRELQAHDNYPLLCATSKGDDFAATKCQIRILLNAGAKPNPRGNFEFIEWVMKMGTKRSSSGYGMRTKRRKRKLPSSHWHKFWNRFLKKLNTFRMAKFPLETFLP